MNSRWSKLLEGSRIRAILAKTGEKARSRESEGKREARSAKSQTKCSFRPAASFPRLLRFPRDIYKSLRFHTKQETLPARASKMPCTVPQYHRYSHSPKKHTNTDGHKISQLMIHELFLFRIQLFPIIGFTHLYCTRQPSRPTSPTHRERINTVNREIRKYA